MGEAAARLQREAEAWRLPASPASVRHQAVALLHVERMLPVLLDGHAGSTWTEHHTSGLLDREDLKLPARSSSLVARLRERLLHAALAECLETAGAQGLACGACARAAFSSHGWVEVYHRWAERLKAAGREHDVRATYEVAVSRGVWQHHLQRPNDLYVPGLRSQPFWDAAEVPVARELEAAFPAILREYRALRADAERGSWTAVFDQPLLLKGDWTDFKLVENGKRPTNTRIRIQLGLEVGRCLIFDDSFEHEVEHSGPDARVVLIADLWHPDFGEALRQRHLHGRHRRRYEGALRRGGAGAYGEATAAEGPNYEPHRVDPVEVRFLEEELRGLEEVREAVATIHLDALSGEQTLVAYVECASDLRGTAANDACGRCAERLKPYGLSFLVLAVPEWPRAADGSIDRERLPPPPPELLAGVCGR